MNNEKPFIYLFRTPKGYYIYDVNTNVILKTHRDVYLSLSNALKNDGQSSENEDTDTFVAGVIGRMKRDGYLLSDKLSEIVHPMDKVYEYYLNNKLLMVTLQITQQCNLRCAYCAYSGSYFNRTHSSRRMSLETAKKAIDFLIDNSQDSAKASVGFYGGEPLLEFERIKEFIEYTLKRAEGKEIFFTATVNGTLLSDEVIEYFQEHGLMLFISLDGPRNIHDKNRKFAGGDRSTFEKIMESLDHIRRKYPEYFNKIAFNSVLDPRNDLGCVNEFFTSYDMVKDLFTRSSLVNDFYLKQEIEADENFFIQWDYETFKMFLSKLGRLDKQFASKLVEDAYLDVKQKMCDDRKPTEPLKGKGHPGGPCIPGVSRLFVDVEGNIFPCERVSEDSEVVRIGNVEGGFDVEKARKLLNIGRITEQQCINCWAFRFCNQCAATADNLSELSAEKKLSKCNGVRRYAEYLLKDYCTLKEMGHNFSENDTLLSCYND